MFVCGRCEHRSFGDKIKDANIMLLTGAQIMIVIDAFEKPNSTPVKLDPLSAYEFTCLAPPIQRSATSPAVHIVRSTRTGWSDIMAIYSCKT